MTINTQKLALQALAGHGHVKPRPDGVRARCGGPAICRVCQQEKAQLEVSQRMDQAFHPLDGQHINQGSVDAAADAYEREYLRDLMDKALGRAYSMGQTYWMQADSESYSQNRRSDETQAKFDVMRAETVAKLCAALGHIDAQTAEIARLREALGSIRQYGNDTLSGRADGGPDDRKWQREAVIEMRNRARAALSGTNDA